jgi:hypothetical protein
MIVVIPSYSDTCPGRLASGLLYFDLIVVCVHPGASQLLHLDLDYYLHSFSIRVIIGIQHQ